MSFEVRKKNIPILEILAMTLVIIGVVFIFNVHKGRESQERELRNAIRFQDVSQIADALWRASLQSTEYAVSIETFPRDMLCEQSTLTTRDVESLVIPQFISEIPIDPTGKPYQISFDPSGRVSVCSPWGEEEDGNKLISITR